MLNDRETGLLILLLFQVLCYLIKKYIQVFLSLIESQIQTFIIYPIFQEFSEVLSKYYGKFILAIACHFEAMHIIT